MPHNILDTPENIGYKRSYLIPDPRYKVRWGFVTILAVVLLTIGYFSDVYRDALTGGEYNDVEATFFIIGWIWYLLGYYVTLPPKILFSKNEEVEVINGQEQFQRIITMVGLSILIAFTIFNPIYALDTETMNALLEIMNPLTLLTISSLLIPSLLIELFVLRRRKVMGQLEEQEDG